jgi:23S rRNA G2445 N2-methylase RlmL
MRISKGKKRGNFQVDIWLDMCGEPLSNRHYRAGDHPAPLRENLACALVKLTDWDPHKDVFIDTMCGSGTILIEAALLKGNIPPCFLRIKNESPFSFLAHKWFREKGLLNPYQRQVEKIHELTLKGLETITSDQFFGFDMDLTSLNMANRNLQNCGLTKFVKLKKGDAPVLRPPKGPPGIVICNPPYGERMGNEAEIENLMHDYGENLKHNFAGFRAYILTVPLMRKKISLSTSKRFPLKNGNIDCQLVRYDLY